jgi:eukaryotic-like serine/threonine-protein kinase
MNRLKGEHLHRLIVANADRIIELLHEAKARPAGAERDQFLAEACRDDAALKDQIVSLLQADANDGDSDFLKIGQLLRPTILPSEKPGDRIGRYKLLEQIGEGGCGVVYMAEQEEPVRRRVALKVIKLGMDTKQVIARFEAERQALAMMDHPNIAKVLDAGATETGRPFFVMELVRGIKITDYCDQNNLPTHERLKLFIQVCQAVQHAHQKGIIHRDIKPSNILVTQHDDVAVPKVIDFGIAKATVGQLTDKTVFTAFAQFIGTPAYMSPEQAQMSGLDVDTRADIYSLGVLLYELLTGHTPFDAKELLAAGLDEMRRKIREDEPAKPSTRLSTMQAMDLTTVARRRHVEPPKLIHLIRGDLDWLVMKCLEKDRTRRYDTANGLAMDIQRHLSHEPITARPPSRLYEFQKSVQRHKFGFAAATALGIVLGLGILVSTWQALRATRAEQEQVQLRKEAEGEKKTAQTQAAKSQQVAQFMQDMLKGVGPSTALGRDTTMLREILDKTAARIAEDLKEQPELEAELRNAIGTVYRELGEFDKAVEMHRQALAMQRLRLGNEHPSVAATLNHLGTALRFQAKLAESEVAYRESLAIRRKLLGNEHTDIAQSLNDLASLLSIELRNDEPEALLREAIAIRRKHYGNEHRAVAESLDNLAHVLNRRGQIAEAIAMHKEALEIRKRVLGDTHPELIHSYKNLAGAFEGQGNLSEAETMLRAALALCEKLLGEQHPEMPAIRAKLASLLHAQDKPAEAEAFDSKLVALRQQERASMNGETPAMHKNAPNGQDPNSALALQAQAVRLGDEGRLAEAESRFHAAIILFKQLVRQNPKRSDQPVQLGHCQWKLGQLLSATNRLEEAEQVFREALLVFEQAARDFPAEGFFRQEQAFTQRLLAGVAATRKQTETAERRYHAAIDLYSSLLVEAPTDRIYLQERNHAVAALVQLYETTGQLAKMAEWKKQLSAPSKADK